MSKPNVMLIHFYDPFWQKVSLGLAQQGVKIKCIITHAPDFYQNDPLFAETRIIDEKNFEKLPAIRQLENEKYDFALSEELIKKLSFEENVFLSITDRLTFFPTTVHQRKGIYYTLLRYWLKLLKEEDIRVVILPRAPHMGPENVLYAVAMSLGLKVLYIERTSINDRVIIQDKGIEHFSKDKESKSTVDDLHRKIEPGLYQEIRKPSLWTGASKKINEAVISGKRPAKTALTSQIKKLAPFCLSLFKDSDNSHFFLTNRKNWQVWPQVFRVNRKYKKLRNFYEQNCSPTDLNKKYVFFPLHFQVERTTLPSGGVFENQLLALDILAKSIPADWLIYIKEHPRQFEDGDLRKTHFRDIEDYETMLRYKNVRLVSIKSDSSELQQHSEAVATITGSNGWESLLNNKPCLVFGYPWYLPCRSCFRVTSIDECKSALQEIEKMLPKEVEKNVLSFVANYQNKFVVSSNDHKYAIKSKLDYDVLVKNLAQALNKEINHSA